MYQFMLSPQFNEWFAHLSDARIKTRILTRIRSAESGHFGDIAPVGEGVMEMRIHYGPGFRLYYKRHGEIVYLMLAGGDKSTQERDIKRAIAMAKESGKERP